MDMHDLNYAGDIYNKYRKKYKRDSTIYKKCISKLNETSPHLAEIFEKSTKSVKYLEKEDINQILAIVNVLINTTFKDSYQFYNWFKSNFNPNKLRITSNNKIGSTSLVLQYEFISNSDLDNKEELLYHLDGDLEDFLENLIIEKLQDYSTLN